MHTIQFNALLKKRKRTEYQTDEWMRFAESQPESFVKAIGFPRAKVILDKENNITVKDGAHVVAYYNKHISCEVLRVTHNGVFPMNLFAQFGPPPTVCFEQKMIDGDALHCDVISIILQYLGVKDACAFGLVCKLWNECVKYDNAFWRRHCKTLLGKVHPNPRSACLKLTLYGFKSEHSGVFRRLLCDGSFYRITTWIISAYLGRQVQRIRYRRAPCRGFTLNATTRDYEAIFLFDVPGYVRVCIRETWIETTEVCLVQKYQNWIEDF